MVREEGMETETHEVQGWLCSSLLTLSEDLSRPSPASRDRIIYSQLYFSSVLLIITSNIALLPRI